MKSFYEDILLSTRKRIELIDITNDVNEVMRKSKVKAGICVIHTVHSTAAIIVNEHEDGLVKDIVRKIELDFTKDGGWLHDKIDDNAYAHLASSFMGPTRIFPVQNHALVRGPWQSIYLLELDGPRTRKVTLQVMGE